MRYIRKEHSLRSVVVNNERSGDVIYHDYDAYLCIVDLCQCFCSLPLCFVSSGDNNKTIISQPDVFGLLISIVVYLALEIDLPN